MATILFVAGCSDLTGPQITNIMTQDKTVIDYSFIDYAVSCEDHLNVNLSNPAGYCNDTFVPVITTFSNATNFSQTCCTFNNKCVDFVYPNTSIGVSEICSNNVTGYQPLSVVNTSIGLKVLCCNGAGGNCYVDTMVNVYDPSSACKMNYTQLPVSSYFDNSSWYATCCSSGVSG